MRVRVAGVQADGRERRDGGRRSDTRGACERSWRRERARWG